jgi:hypothetical protein
MTSLKLPLILVTTEPKKGMKRDRIAQDPMISDFPLRFCPYSELTDQ